MNNTRSDIEALASDLSVILADRAVWEGRWRLNDDPNLLNGLLSPNLDLRTAKKDWLKACWDQLGRHRQDLAGQLLAHSAKAGHPLHLWLDVGRLGSASMMEQWADFLGSVETLNPSQEENLKQQLTWAVECYLVCTEQAELEKETVAGGWVGRVATSLDKQRPGAGKEWAEHAWDVMAELWIQTPLDNDPWERLAKALVEAGVDLTGPRGKKDASLPPFQNRLHEQLWVDGISGREMASPLAQFMLDHGVVIQEPRETDGPNREAWDWYQNTPEVRRKRLGIVARETVPATQMKPRM